MRRTTRAAWFLALLPCAGPAWADACPGCVLGIWDDAGLTRNYGTMQEDEPKTLWVGIRYAGADSGLTGVEFSIAGLADFFVPPPQPVIPTALFFGNVQAPPDTSESTPLRGGMNAAWAECLTGDQALFRVTLVYSGPPPSDRTLEVKRKYPPTNREFRAPLFVRCDDPFFTKVSVTGGCYVLNPSANPVPACQLPVVPNTWSGVKALFR